MGTYVSFIFRGYNPYIGGSFFLIFPWVLGSKGYFITPKLTRLTLGPPWSNRYPVVQLEQPGASRIFTDWKLTMMLWEQVFPLQI